MVNGFQPIVDLRVGSECASALFNVLVSISENCFLPISKQCFICIPPENVRIPVVF